MYQLSMFVDEDQTLSPARSGIHEPILNNLPVYELCLYGVVMQVSYDTDMIYLFYERELVGGVTRASTMKNILEAIQQAALHISYLTNP